MFTALAYQNDIRNHKADFAADKWKIYARLGLVLNNQGNTMYGKTFIISGALAMQIFCKKYVYKNPDNFISTACDHVKLDNQFLGTRKCDKSRSRSRSKSRDRSRSKSRDRSRSKSRCGSRSKSRGGSRSKSRGGSRSKSRTLYDDKSK